MDSAWIVALECLSDDTWFDPDSHSFFYAFLCLSFHSHWTRIQSLLARETNSNNKKKLNRKNSLVRFYHWHFWSNNACLSVDDDGSMFKCYRREHGRAWEMVINIFWWLSYHFFHSLCLCRNRILIGLRLTSRSRLAHQHTHTRRRRFLCRTNTRAQRWFSRNSKKLLFLYRLCDFSTFRLEFMHGLQRVHFITGEFWEFQVFEVSRVCHIYEKYVEMWSSECFTCDSYHDYLSSVITWCALHCLSRTTLASSSKLPFDFNKTSKNGEEFFHSTEVPRTFFSLFTFSHFQVRERRNKYASRVTLNAVKLNSLRTLSKFLV